MLLPVFMVLGITCLLIIVLIRPSRLDKSHGPSDATRLDTKCEEADGVQAPLAAKPDDKSCDFKPAVAQDDIAPWQEPGDGVMACDEERQGVLPFFDEPQEGLFDEPQESVLGDGARLYDYTVIDTETTGLSPFDSKVVEIAALRVRSGKVVDSFTSLVNPQMPIPKEASAVNHITDDMVKDAPTWAEVEDQFNRFIGDDVLVGHNLIFDLNAIGHERQDPLRHYCLDTLRCARQVFDAKSYSLGNLCRSLGLGKDQDHRALGDVTLTHLLLQAIQEHATFVPQESGKYYKQARYGFTVRISDYPTATDAPDNPLKDQRVAFVGEMLGKKQMMRALCAQGGKLMRSIGKTTTLIVTGKYLSNGEQVKISQACMLKARTVGVQEFCAMLGQAGAFEAVAGQGQAASCEAGAMAWDMR